VRHWHRLPSEAVDAPSLAQCQVGGDPGQPDLVGVTLPMAGELELNGL